MSTSISPDRFGAADAVWGYGHEVWRLASQLCRHRQDAEGVTQSARVKAVQQLDRFRWETSRRTWLHRIASDECRMLRRRTVPASLDELIADAATGPQPRTGSGASGPGPKEAAIEAETRRRVVRALGGLSDHYRTAVLLKDGLGLSAAGVAAAMGVTVSTARSLLHRAWTALRGELAE